MNILFISTIFLLIFVTRCMSGKPGEQHAPGDYKMPFDYNDDVLQQLIKGYDGSEFGTEHRQFVDQQRQIFGGLRGSTSSNRMAEPSGSGLTMDGLSVVPKITHGGESIELAPLPMQLISGHHYHNSAPELQPPSHQHNIVDIQAAENRTQGGIENHKKRKAKAMEGQQPQWVFRGTGSKVREDGHAIDNYTPNRVRKTERHSEMSKELYIESGGLEDIIASAVGTQSQQEFSMGQSTMAQSQRHDYQSDRPTMASGGTLPIGHYLRRGGEGQLPASTLGMARTLPLPTGASPSTAQIIGQTGRAAQKAGGERIRD